MSKNILRYFNESKEQNIENQAFKEVKNSKYLETNQ